MLPDLSIILCTRNRPDALEAVLGDVAEQVAAGDEWIVVDQSDVPMPRRPGGRVWVDEGRGLPRARNIGLGLARNPVVLFLDDDVRLHAGCLDGHRRRMADERVGGVVGGIHERVDLPNSRRPGNRVAWDGRIRVCLDRGSAAPTHSLKGANMALRASAARAAGGFDEGYGGTAFFEDADIAARIGALGYAIWYEPDAAVDHLSAPTGGVRAPPTTSMWWRFHNTGRWLARHRGPVGLGAALPAHVALSVRDALRHGSPHRIPDLLGALARGYAGA
jgi:GT2 family glycosyltransferase